MADSTKTTHLQYTADASGALSEIDRLIARMAAVQDKTATLRLRVEDEGLRRWAEGMDRAGDASDRFGRSADRAGSSARSSGEGVRESARAHDELSRSADRGSGSLDRFSGSAMDSRQSLDGLSASSGRFGQSLAGSAFTTAISRLDQMHASTDRVAAVQQRAL